MQANDNHTGKNVLPVTTIISRMQKHRDEAQRQIALQPWWNLKRRWIFGGVAAAYQYEIDALNQLDTATTEYHSTVELEPLG